MRASECMTTRLGEGGRVCALVSCGAEHTCERVTCLRYHPLTIAVSCCSVSLQCLVAMSCCSVVLQCLVAVSCCRLVAASCCSASLRVVVCLSVSQSVVAQLFPTPLSHTRSFFLSLFLSLSHPWAIPRLCRCLYTLYIKTATQGKICL